MAPDGVGEIGRGVRPVVEVRRERFARCRAAMEQLTCKFKDVAPEAIVILGNDQREFFGPDLTPSVTIYNGAKIRRPTSSAIRFTRSCW